MQEKITTIEGLFLGEPEQKESANKRVTKIPFTPTPYDENIIVVKEIIYKGSTCLEKGDKIRIYFKEVEIINVKAGSDDLVTLKEKEIIHGFSKSINAFKIEKLISNELVKDEVLKTYILE